MRFQNATSPSGRTTCSGFSLSQKVPGRVRVPSHFSWFLQVAPRTLSQPPTTAHTPQLTHTSVANMPLTFEDVYALLVHDLDDNASLSAVLERRVELVYCLVTIWRDTGESCESFLNNFPMLQSNGCENRPTLIHVILKIRNHRKPRRRR